MIALEVGNLDGLIVFILGIMIGPPIIFSLIGLSIKKKSPTGAKIFFILAALYLLIGLGFCGSMLT